MIERIHPAAFRERYARAVTSQSGEDGIIAELVRRLSPPKTCVEFGAGDGITLSNCRTLWHDNGWRALLIEADADRFAKLADRVADHPNATAVQSFVMAAGASSLPEIMAAHGFPAEIGVLSIDIDANDLEILESLDPATLHIVVIEFNHEFPASVIYRDPPGVLAFRHSAKATLDAAHQLGFEAVCCIGANLVLVNAARHELGWLERDVPIEAMFDEAFRAERMRDPRIIRSKSTTRAVAFAEPPGPLLRAKAQAITQWRSMRGRHHTGPETAELPTEVVERLLAAGVFV